MKRRLRLLKADFRTWWFRRFPHLHPQASQVPVRRARKRARGGPFLAVGPLNTAGQGWNWARAVEQNYPQAQAEAFAIRRGSFAFISDYVVEPEVSKLEGWGFEQFARMKRTYTHVLNESFSPMLGRQFKSDIRAEILWLQDSGKKVAVILHGSELRHPDRHAAREPLSPFKSPDFQNLDKLRKHAEKTSALIAGTNVPVFVSTPDLLDDAPTATWLPIVVDIHHFPDPAPLRMTRPKVLHLPSSEALKGTALVVPILERLHEQGVIQFVRPGLISSEEALTYIQDCDIVADQFTLGIYGVLAAEAMAAGKVVVSHVSDTVRDRVGQATGLSLPIVQAPVSDLAEVISGLVANHDLMNDIARAGRSFVREVHDGRRSVAALRPFLDS